MSQFCGGTGSIPAMTINELNQVFSNGFLPSGLPPMPNGLASEQWVRSYISQLTSQGRLPRIPDPKQFQNAPFSSPEAQDPLKTYVQKENEVQTKLKQEYCFYERRYFSALNDFLTTVSNVSLKGQAPAVVDQKLSITRTLNQKLTLLTQITNGIAKTRYSNTHTMQSEINAINGNLEKRRKELLEQRDILMRESAAADLHKRMVDYTTEKNHANQNLLTLYGILNITAIAMIFYIART
jgi:hypothetical protein